MGIGRNRKRDGGPMTANRAEISEGSTMLSPLDDTGAQVARLDHYAAWARSEIERLADASVHPERQAVLRENLEGVRVVLARILAQRAAMP